MYDSIAARTQPEVFSERDILALANNSENVRHIRKQLKKSPEVYRACSQIISEETFLQVQKKLREREQRVVGLKKAVCNESKYLYSRLELHLSHQEQNG